MTERDRGSDLVTLSANDGADSHCGISNIVHTSSLIYDWIAEQLR